MHLKGFALLSLIVLVALGCQEPLTRHQQHAGNSAKSTAVLKTVVDEKSAAAARPALTKLADEWDSFKAEGPSKTDGAPTEEDMKAVSKSRAEFLTECERVRAIPGAEAKIGEALTRLCRIR
jgi:hypothetical protein